MKGIASLFVGYVFIAGSAGFADSATNLKCLVQLHNSSKDSVQIVDLQPASFDAKFLTAKIDRFSAAVDTFSLADGTVNMIIVDNVSERAVSMVAALRTIPKTDVLDGAVTYMDPKEDGSTDQVKVQCNSRIK